MTTVFIFYLTLLSILTRMVLGFLEAQIYRMLATCPDKKVEERISLLDDKLVKMSKGHLRQSSLNEAAEYVSRYLFLNENEKRLETSPPSRIKPIFKSYTRGVLQFEETKGMLF